MTSKVAKRAKPVKIIEPDETDPVEIALAHLNVAVKQAIEKGRLDYGRTWQTMLHPKGKADPYFSMLVVGPMTDNHTKKD